MCKLQPQLFECGHPDNISNGVCCAREMLAVERDGHTQGLYDQCPDYYWDPTLYVLPFKCDACSKEDRGRERARQLGIEYVPPIKPAETIKKAVGGGAKRARRLTGGLARSVTHTFKRTRAGTVNLVRNHQDYWDAGLNRTPSMPTERDIQAEVPFRQVPARTFHQSPFSPGQG
ncbi:hypothetical protein IFR04_010850 [Cadophora malorum]|uniref:Uncharacterized protein n=1 Tax=Cadophora malorum TaxID=108018 RepID=A0A8H7T730_9HELO|nr:hypothetical protein IFR04_010850 [Cadophora malorum]